MDNIFILSNDNTVYKVRKSLFKCSKYVQSKKSEGSFSNPLFLQELSSFCINCVICYLKCLEDLSKREISKLIFLLGNDEEKVILLEKTLNFLQIEKDHNIFSLLEKNHLSNYNDGQK